MAEVLRDMVDIMFEEYDGDIQAANKALRTEPTRILLNKIKTKNKRTFATVAILDDLPDDPLINPETGEILEADNADA